MLTSDIYVTGAGRNPVSPAGIYRGWQRLLDLSGAHTTTPSSNSVVAPRLPAGPS